MNTIVYVVRYIPIRLTDERRQHIVRRHPEMITFQESVLETVSQPSQIQVVGLTILGLTRAYNKGDHRIIGLKCHLNSTIDNIALTRKPL